MNYSFASPPASGKYPNFHGARDNAPETSRDAAKTVVDIAKTHRDKILEALRGETFGLSSEGIAGKVGLTKYSVRPRISELVASGDVIVRPFREKNAEGRSAVIWRAVQ
jgi:predicted ArsR family transcriptional regulator